MQLFDCAMIFFFLFANKLVKGFYPPAGEVCAGLGSNLEPAFFVNLFSLVFQKIGIFTLAGEVKHQNDNHGHRNTSEVIDNQLIIKIRI